MSDANVGLVRRLYAAFGKSDVAAIVAMVAPDCRWHVVGRASDFPALGPHHGRDGVRAFFEGVAEYFTFEDFTPREFYAIGDKVIAIGSYAMTVRKTGRHLAGEWIHVFTVADGQIADFREFTDTARAGPMTDPANG